jgi:hypothetical protein
MKTDKKSAVTVTADFFAAQVSIIFYLENPFGL